MIKALPKITFSFLFFLVAIFILCNTEKSFPQAANTFARTYQAPGMNGGLSLATTNDDGFIGTGQHETVASSCEIYAYKVDGCGNPQWFYTYGGSGSDGGKCIQQTADGGYIIAGLDGTTPQDGYYDNVLVKLSASGTMQWTRRFGYTNNDYGLWVNQTSDGGYIETGFLYGLGLGGTDIVLTKTDAAGTIQWIEALGGAGEEWGDYVEQTSDGGYIVGGWTTSFTAGGYDFCLIKVDANGAIQWSNAYGGTGNEGSSAWGITAQVTADGGYMICGNTDGYGSGSNDFMLVKTDGNGNLQWSKVYGGPADDQPRSAHQTKDGGYIMCGLTTSFGAGSLDAYLIKVDANGNLQWSNARGGTASDRGSMVRQTTDGGYAMSIVTSSFGANYFDPLFVRVDSNGVCGCNEVNCATMQSSVSPTVTSGGSAIAVAPNISTSYFTQNSFTPADNFICFHCTTVPTFSVQNSIMCVGDTNHFYNTTSIGKKCFENWFINGAFQGVATDTFTYVATAAGNYSIQLIASCGNSTDTSTIPLNIYDQPIPNFTAPVLCAGDTVHFTDASTIASGSIVSWSWNFGDGSPTSNLQNPIHIYSTGGTYSVTLTVTNAVGCPRKIVKPLIVYNVPVANYSHNDVCFGDTVHFTNLSTIAAPASIANYIWVFGDGSPTSNLVNPSHYYTQPGVYYATLVATTTDGCSNATNIQVNVYGYPQSGFSFANVCLYDSAHFSNGSVNPITSGINWWSWNFGDASANDTVHWNPSHLYASTGTFVVTLITSASPLGCKDTLKDTISVFSVPTANFSAVNVCKNSPMSFTDLSSAVAPDSIATWNWNFGDATTSTIQNPIHTYSSSGTFTVTLISGTNNGCIDTVKKTVTVHALPTINFNATNVCVGQTVNFNNTSTIAATDTISIWNWNFGDGTSTSTAQNPSHTYTASGSYTVTLTATSTFGCKDSLKKKIIIHPNPVADFSVNDTIGCPPLCVNFKDLSTISSGSVTSWVWNFGDGSPNNTSQNPTHCYKNLSASNMTFTVSLTITSDSGCTKTKSKTNFITVFPSTNANAGASVSIDNGTSTVLSASGGTTYSWNTGETKNSITVSPTSTTNYCVFVTDKNKCTDSACVTVYVEYPCDAFFLPTAFSPNGDGKNDVFCLRGWGGCIKDFSLVIYDRWGAKVFESIDPSFCWDGTYQGKMENAAVYFYQMKSTLHSGKEFNKNGNVSLIR